MTPCCAAQAIPGSPSSVESPRHASEPAHGQGSPDALQADGPVGGGGGAVTHGRGPRLYVGGVPDDVQVRLQVMVDGNFGNQLITHVCLQRRACMLQLCDQHARRCTGQLLTDMCHSC